MPDPSKLTPARQHILRQMNKGWTLITLKTSCAHVLKKADKTEHINFRDARWLYASDYVSLESSDDGLLHLLTQKGREAALILESRANPYPPDDAKDPLGETAELEAAP